jgi:hypothetical protein
VIKIPTTATARKIQPPHFSTTSSVNKYDKNRKTARKSKSVTAIPTKTANLLVDEFASSHSLCFLVNSSNFLSLSLSLSLSL